LEVNTYQLLLDPFWRTPKVESPYTDEEMLSCPIHGDFAPNAFYTGREIEEDIAQTGRLTCPYCLMEIVGEGPMDIE
jgi:hypothetical protein